MIFRNAQLETVCGITSVLPQNALAEVAFAGKSNVGKSSLINALMNRKSLARTSAQPGKTQTINFYRVEGLERKKGAAPADEVRDTVYDLYLVDLPGYGYAAAAQEVKAEWGKLIERYLGRSGKLKVVFLLIDIRHAPGANDRLMYDWICKNGFEPVILATKLDKIKKSQVQKQLGLIKKELNTKEGTVLIPFSALTKQGREEIWEQIKQLTGEDTGDVGGTYG